MTFKLFLNPFWQTSYVFFFSVYLLFFLPIHLNYVSILSFCGFDDMIIIFTRQLDPYTILLCPVKPERTQEPDRVCGLCCQRLRQRGA